MTMTSFPQVHDFFEFTGSEFGFDVGDSCDKVESVGGSESVVEDSGTVGNRLKEMVVPLGRWTRNLLPKAQPKGDNVGNGSKVVPDDWLQLSPLI